MLAFSDLMCPAWTCVSLANVNSSRCCLIEGVADLNPASTGPFATKTDVHGPIVQVQGLMQGAYSYRNAFHAVSSIVQQHSLQGLMKGYWATNSVWFPWNMIYIASYERSKTALARRLQVGACSSCRHRLLLSCFCS